MAQSPHIPQIRHLQALELDHREHDIATTLESVLGLTVPLAGALDRKGRSTSGSSSILEIWGRVETVSVEVENVDGLPEINIIFFRLFNTHECHDPSGGVLEDESIAGA